MQSLPYVYIQSERQLFTVGHYSPAGWLPESDHPSADSAAARVNYLNGGPAPKPARPTGPTPAYVRELEAELLAMKAEIIALALKADELTQELTGVNRPEDAPLVDTLPAAVSVTAYELMELAHTTLVAAKEAQS